MESSELVGQQPRVLEVVLVLRDAVPLDVGMAGVDGLEHEGDAHLSQGVLVTLERPPEGSLVLRIAGKALVQLVSGEGPLRFEQGGDEVDQPFQAIHDRRSLRTGPWPPWP